MNNHINMAFAQDNARYEKKLSIIENFIATDNFWQLFTSKHQVLCGSRGSGKTALTKMASFSFLKYYDHPKAREIIEKFDHIGVFVNTDIRFTGSLKNKIWPDEATEERYFIWKFNINCFKAFAVVVDSLLQHLFGKETREKFLLEKKFVQSVGDLFFGKKLNLRLVELPDYISNYESIVRSKLNKNFLDKDSDKEFIADFFSTEIFEPIQFAIRMISNFSEKLSNSDWLFFIDEAEFLTETHLRIINSYMRTSPDRVFIKMATLPYYHKTLETNIGVPLQPDDDFEYVYLDAASIYELNFKSRQIYTFARELFRKRIEYYLKRGPSLTLSPENMEIMSDLDLVLRISPFEDPKCLPENIEDALRWIQPYVNEVTFQRASKLSNKKVTKERRKKFGSEMWRKITGMILLIEDVRSNSGNSQMSCYSGTETFIRCTDGIPRLIINLFQEVSREAVKVYNRNDGNLNKFVNKNKPILSQRAQTRVLMSFAEKRFSKVYQIPRVGLELKGLCETIGDYFFNKLHKEKISTDIVGSFTVDEKINERLWSLIKEGIAFGFIFPNVTDRQPYRSDQKRGSYRMAYALSPKFNIFPRRGVSRSLIGILRARKRDSVIISSSNTNMVQGSFDLDGLPKEQA